MFSLRTAAFGCLALLLSACASFPQQAYNRPANTAVKRIAIVTPAISSKSSAWLAVHPGASFGLVGGLVAAADISSKSNRLTEVVQAEKFDQTQFFIEALQKELQTKGYETVVVAVDRDREKFEFLETYPAIAGSQAVLDMYSGSYGYMAAGVATPYRPTLWLASRLVSASDSTAVLFADQIFYNPFGQPKDVITLNAGTEYDANSFDELIANPARVTDGLRVAAAAVATELARQLQ